MTESYICPRDEMTVWNHIKYSLYFLFDVWTNQRRIKKNKDLNRDIVV